MTTKEQIYYEVLVRSDHPVFAKDFSTTTTISSPLNSIYNRIMAKQLVRIKALIDELRLNSFPNTVTQLTISDWESEYFGFTKPQLSLSQRVSELLIKVNKRFHMNVQDALDLSRAIVGQTPEITRNANRSGWVLGRKALGIGTILGGGAGGQGLYLVYFPRPVNSALLKQLDQRLTIIEKAGSRHVVKAPIPRWILGRSALGRDTTLGA
jgi:hypothetical protein